MKLLHLVSYGSAIVLLPWDTSFNSNYDYSSSNSVAARKSLLGTSNQGLRSVDTITVTSSNKFYVEVYSDNTNNDTNTAVGVINGSNTSTKNLNTNNAWSINASGFIQHAFANLAGGPHSNVGNLGFTFAFALDCNNGKIWFGKDNGPGSGSITWWGSPSLGTGQAYTLPSDTYYIAGLTNLNSSTKALTIRANSSTQLYAPPSGFSAMSN